MSRIHGTRAIIAESITGASLAQIVEAAKINLTALYASANGPDTAPFDSNDVLKPEFGGSGINNGTNTLTMGGDLNFSSGFTTTGAFTTTLAQTGNVVLTLPSVDGTLATQQYVDGIAQALDIKNSCLAATQAALPAVTYDNGAAGVGATLTADANGALPAQDGVTLSVGSRLLVKNQVAALQNGIYVVTALGDESNPFVLTRAVDCDGSPENEVSGGMFAFVEQGTVSAGHGYVTIWDGNIVVGTDPVNFTQFSGAGQLVAGNGISISGNTVSIDAGYWDDVQAINTLDMANLVNEQGLVTADLIKLAALDSTAEEINALNGAGCTNADFVKLHDLQVSALSINDLVTLTILASNASGEGASLVGIESITNMTATTVQGALAELQGDIDALEASVGAISFSGTNYLDAETTVYGAFVTLDSALGTLQSDLDAEVIARGDADTTLQGNIDAEEAARIAADDVLQGNIDAEAAARVAADGVLQANIDKFSSEATGEGASLVALETDEYGSVIANLDATTVQGALAELQGDIDAILAVGGGETTKSYEYVGVGDNSTTLFTVAEGSFIAGSLQVFINGLLVKKGAGAEEVNETNAAAGTFTFGDAPKTNDEIIVTYRY